MDPPQCSSRACFHTAFIAFSVPFVCYWKRKPHWPIVLLPDLPGLGWRCGLLGSGLYRRVTLHYGLSSGCGVRAVFHVGSHCTWGVFAAVGHTRPHSLRSAVTWARRAWGKEEVRGYPSWPLPPPMARACGRGGGDYWPGDKGNWETVTTHWKSQGRGSPCTARAPCAHSAGGIACDKFTAGPKIANV